MKLSAYIAMLSLVLGFVIGCKKENSNYGISGRVIDGDTGASIDQAKVEIEKQVVSSGVFGQTFQSAMTTTTDASGNYSGTWPRENFAALRLNAEKENYISASTDLSVDAFKEHDFRLENEDVKLFKEAFIQVDLANTGMTTASDRLAFTFLNANFNCNCCSNGWRVFEGAAVDTTFTCRIYGNRWIKYQIQSTLSSHDSIYVDSVFCPANNTSVVSIDY
jgi:hypothetical protein